MEITISFRHMESSEALKDYVMKKIERISRLNQRVIDLNIVLSQDHNKNVAEFLLRLKGDTFKCKEESDDMYAAIDLAIDTVERYLAREKEQIKTKRQRI